MTASLSWRSSGVIGGARTRDVSQQQVLETSAMHAGGRDDTTTTTRSTTTTTTPEEPDNDDRWRKLYNNADDDDDDDDEGDDNDVFVSNFSDDVSSMFNDAARSALRSYCVITVRAVVTDCIVFVGVFLSLLAR